MDQLQPYSDLIIITFRYGGAALMAIAGIAAAILALFMAEEARDFPRYMRPSQLETYWKPWVWIAVVFCAGLIAFINSF